MLPADVAIQAMGILSRGQHSPETALLISARGQYYVERTVTQIRLWHARPRGAPVAIPFSRRISVPWRTLRCVKSISLPYWLRRAD